MKKNLSLTIHVFGNACQRVVFSVFTLAFFRIMRLQSHRKLSQTLNMYTVHCKRIFTKIKKTTNAFRWLHYKILYILLPTGRCLYLRRMVDSALCAFCHNAEETLTHMFWNCPKVQTVLDWYSRLAPCAFCTHNLAWRVSNSGMQAWCYRQTFWPVSSYGQTPYFCFKSTWQFASLKCCYTELEN